MRRKRTNIAKPICANVSGNGSIPGAPAATDQFEDQLTAVFSSGDRLSVARLYIAAADAAEEAGDRDRACFFLTHAWVFLLEAGDPLAEMCRARLLVHGRV